MIKKLLERFIKMNCKNKSVEKVIKRKGDELYAKWKGYNSSFNSWIDKKEVIYMGEYSPEPKSSGERLKVELDLSNYATKADLKKQKVLVHQNLIKRSI